MPVVYLKRDEDVVRHAPAWLLRLRRWPCHGLGGADSFGLLDQHFSKRAPVRRACVFNGMIVMSAPGQTNRLAGVGRH